MWQHCPWMDQAARYPLEALPRKDESILVEWNANSAQLDTTITPDDTAHCLIKKGLVVNNRAATFLYSTVYN